MILDGFESIPFIVVILPSVTAIGVAAASYSGTANDAGETDGRD